MRSIPQALFWETLSNGRWSLPGMFFLALLLPLLVYGSLSGIGVDAQSQEFVVLQFAFIPMVIFELAIGIIIAQGPLSRLYARPISNNAIVAWHMLSGAAILAVETAAAAWILNSLFRVDWPILGPSAFAAAAWSSYLVLLCLTNLQSIMALALAGIPAIFLCGWLQSRYGSWLSPPKHNWSEFTGSEAVTLLAAFGICYVLTTFAVKLARCGERLPELGLLSLLGRCWEAISSPFSRTRRFRSAFGAHSWYEWRIKGILLPLAIWTWGVILALVGLVLWCSGSANFGNMQNVLFWLAAMLALLAIPAGVMFGVDMDFESQGQRDRQLGDLASLNHITYGNSFLFSRPFSNSDFSKTTLLSCFKSVTISWGSLMLALLVCLLFMWSVGARPKDLLSVPLGWFYIAMSLFGPWVAITNTATLALTGRGAKIFVASTIVIVSYVVSFAALRGFLGNDSSAILHGIVVTAIAACLVAASFCAYAAAKKCGYLDFKACVSAAIIFVVATAVGIWLLPKEAWWGDIPIVPAFVCLSILPFAATPLAIGWNRHR